MGTSDRSQRPLFDLGESEPTVQLADGAYTTPTSDTSMREKRYAQGGTGLGAQVRANLSPSSPAATPASRSHTPGSDWARRMTAISGQRCGESSDLPAQISSWLRTLRVTSRWASTLFWLSWKRTATPAGRSLYRLVPSTPSTGATAFGSWPTPATNEPGIRPERLVDKDGNPPEHLNQRLYDKETGRLCEWGLTQQVQMAAWPTPDKGMADGGRSLPEGTTPTGITPDGKKRQVGLTNAVKAWPTPRHEGFDAGGHRGTTDSLHSAVKAQPVGPWPTPKAKEDGRTPEAWEIARQRHYETRKEKGTSSGGPAGANGSLAVTVRRIEEEPKGKLSAAWTLRLMGFPSDWCDDLPPDPLGTTPT